MATVVLLDGDERSVYDWPGSDLRVIGCTLWSAVAPEAAQAVGGGLSDYTAIKLASEPDPDAPGRCHRVGPHRAPGPSALTANL